jgi:UDP-N-acetylglucosamine 4,6-dehydratase
MTRFWITLDQGVRFVIRCLERMHGGEVFVPKIPTTDILAVVEAIAPDCRVREIGIRPGEKLHEVLISEDEARHSVELDDLFVIQPAHPWWFADNWKDGRPLDEGFRYASDTNPEKLDVDQLSALIEED